MNWFLTIMVVIFLAIQKPYLFSSLLDVVRVMCLYLFGFWVLCLLGVAFPIPGQEFFFFFLAILDLDFTFKSWNGVELILRRRPVFSNQPVDPSHFTQACAFSPWN